MKIHLHSAHGGRQYYYYYSGGRAVAMEDAQGKVSGLSRPSSVCVILFVHFIDYRTDRQAYMICEGARSVVVGQVVTRL